MDIGGSGTFLRKIKLSELVPGLRQEIVEFAGRMNYETTLSTSSNLYFIFELYQAEKSKEKKSKEKLKEAEDLILRLASLHYATVAKEEKGRKGKEREKEGKPRLRSIEFGIIVSEATRKLFASIGITDEEKMRRIVETIGEKKVEERVELIYASNLGDELIRRFFPSNPEMLLIADDGHFAEELEVLEMKKSVVDCWTLANGRPPPAEADYGEDPKVLLMDFHEIAKCLGAEIPEAVKKNLEAVEQKVIKYRGKPMYPDDFIKVSLAMGFGIVRKSKHGVLMKNEQTGKMTCVAIAHRKQQMLNTGSVGKCLDDMGIDRDDFEAKRRELGL